MPVALDKLGESDAIRIAAYLDENRSTVESLVAALQRWDTVDFGVVLEHQPENARQTLSLLEQAIPAIHWFYLFETMLKTMTTELGLASVPVKESPARQVTQSTSAGR